MDTWLCRARADVPLIVEAGGDVELEGGVDDGKTELPRAKYAFDITSTVQ
jgi:hypothetical protein